MRLVLTLCIIAVVGLTSSSGFADDEKDHGSPALVNGRASASNWARIKFLLSRPQEKNGRPVEESVRKRLTELLVPLLESEEDEERRLAKDNLEKLGPIVSEPLKKLIETTKYKETKKLATKILKEVGPKSEVTGSFTINPKLMPKDIVTQSLYLTAYDEDGDYANFVVKGKDFSISLPPGKYSLEPVVIGHYKDKNGLPTFTGPKVSVTVTEDQPIKDVKLTVNRKAD